MPLTFSYLSDSSCSFLSFFFLFPSPPAFAASGGPRGAGSLETHAGVCQGFSGDAAVVTAQTFGFGGDGAARSSRATRAAWQLKVARGYPKPAAFCVG